MNQKTRAAVIGVGLYASRYHIPQLIANPNVELAALCGRTPESANKKAEQFGVPVAYTDYREMLDKTPLDALVVSTPHALHYEQARAGLLHGLSVLMDKHLVLHMAGWRELKRLADERGLVLMPALNRHLDPAYLYTRQLIRSGELGEVYFARSLQVHYPTEGYYTKYAYAGGGPFTGRSSHMAAVIPWLTGWQPAEVQATATFSDELEVELSGIINVRATGGQLFQIATIKAGHGFVDEVEVIGTKGRVRIANTGSYMPWVPTRFGPNGEPMSVGELPKGETTTDHFIAVIRGQEENRLPATDGDPSVAIIEAAYDSVRTGQTIRLR